MSEVTDWLLGLDEAMRSLREILEGLEERVSDLERAVFPAMESAEEEPDALTYYEPPEEGEADYWSAVLDGATCDPCRERHMRKLEEGDDWPPLPACSSPNGCRCSTVRFEVE